MTPHTSKGKRIKEIIEQKAKEARCFQINWGEMLKKRPNHKFQCNSGVTHTLFAIAYGATEERARENLKKELKRYY